MIKIKFFGTYRIFSNGEDITSKFSSKGKALLCYMIVENKNIFSRERLVNIFWDNYKRESAFSNLRYTIWQIRKVLRNCNNDIVINSHGKNLIELKNMDMNSDWEEFESIRNEYVKNYDKGKIILRRVSELYGGEFLEDFYICDNLEFNDWVFNIREIAQRFYFQCQMDLAEIYASNNKIKEAINELNRLIRLDPLNEDVYRTMINYQHLSGNKVAAVSTYRNLKTLLRKELNISPSKDLQDFYNNIMIEESKNKVNENIFSYNKYEKFHSKKSNNMKNINIMMSGNPLKLKEFYQKMAQYENKENEHIIDICNTPGKRINYEGIFEILDEIKNYFNDSESYLKEKFDEISSEIRNSKALEEFHLFTNLSDILDGYMKTDIIIRIWNFHFLDQKSIDFISFFYRKSKNNKIVIEAIIDEKWKNSRLDFFMESFSMEKGFKIFK